jgi:tetratricopeptide (TPR) repeat protein
MEDGKKKRARGQSVWSREAWLVTSVVALVAMFAITAVAVSFYRGKQGSLASMWFNRGDAALKANHPRQAIQDLRNALSFAPNNSTFQLRLAQALAADNQIDSAEFYLFDLWSREPGSGEINLELGRLEARKGKSDAVRYFDNAIYGSWETDPIERRFQTRVELFHYWLDQGNQAQAQATLLALAAETPETDFTHRTQIGVWQMQAGDPRHALEQFQEALRVNPRYEAALGGAGAAELAIGQYRDAIPYLQAALRVNPRDAQAAAGLKLAQLVLSSDPFEIGLSPNERNARAIDAYLAGQASLSACGTQRQVPLEPGPGQSPQNEFQQIWARGAALQPLVTQLRGQPQNVLQIMNFVYAAENLVADECGPLEGKDKALWLIGKEHRLTEANNPATH